MSLPTHWRVPAGAKLTWRRWPGEDEYVFYHSATGDTHRLSEVAGLVMEEILTGRANGAKLIEWLRKQGSDTPEATLNQVCAGLAQLELIEAVNPEPGDATG
jgi:hypothetical protein